jgi:hypothetical protein
MSLAKVYDQDNLISITKMQFSALEQRVQSNCFLKLTRDSLFFGDQAGTLRRQPSGRILLVSHFAQKKEAGTGLILTYKADRELWQAFEDFETAQKRSV